VNVRIVPLVGEGAVPDEELARLAAEGSVEAFDALYLRYSDWLTGYAARIVDDRGIGRDVARNTLLAAFRALRHGTVPANVRLWLSRIALNGALEARATRQRPAA
jgi:DNA-directed RNA polymerase specialized sigma24 family protein